jgi:hypothetical protein
MAKIEGITDPRSVRLGRALKNDEAVIPYIDVMRDFPAGKVVLEEGEKGSRVYRLVKAAAKESGVRVTCSWSADKQTLYWRKANAPKVATAVAA